MRTWRDNYLTGRKHCSHCKRWRHVSDFNVRKWADEPHCTVPITLASICRVCDARKHREKKGYNLLQPSYQYGIPGSEEHKEHRRALNRASAMKRRKKKAYRKIVNEYHRIWRNAKIAESKRAA